MKKFLCGVLSLVVFGVLPHVASAGPAYTTAPGLGDTIRITLTNYEQLYRRDPVTGAKVSEGEFIPVEGVNQYLQGIFKVSAIYNDSVDPDNAIWVDGQAGQEITGYFDDFAVSDVVGTDVEFTGGIGKVYIGSSAGPSAFVSSYATTVGPGTVANIGHGSGYADGELWLDLEFVGGIDPTDLSVTLAAIFNPASVLFGAGSGFADIVGGTGQLDFLADASDPGVTAGEQDLSFTSTLHRTSTNGWPVRSQDPILATSAVPEPASLAIWGLFGAAGLCVRRRKAAK